MKLRDTRQPNLVPANPRQAIENGTIERFFRSWKEECTCQHNLRSFQKTKVTITRWTRWYNRPQPHQALGYRSLA